MTYEEVKSIRQNPKSEDCDNEKLARIDFCPLCGQAIDCTNDE